MGVTAAAILTKATGYALVPAALCAVVVGAWRTRRSWAAAGQPAPDRRDRGATRAIAHLAGYRARLASAGGRPGRQQRRAPDGATKFRTLVSYLWQFYLPRLSFQTPSLTYPRFGRLGPLHPGRMGCLRVEEIRFPLGVYWVLAAFTAAIAVFAGAVLVRHWRTLDRALLAFFVFAAGVSLPACTGRTSR